MTNTFAFLLGLLGFEAKLFANSLEQLVIIGGTSSCVLTSLH